MKIEKEDRETKQMDEGDKTGKMRKKRYIL